MIEVSEKSLSFGKSIFIRDVAIPVGQVIEEIAKEYPCSDDQDINLPLRPTAFLTGLEAIIAVGIFVGGWAGNKFLDEIYEAKLGPVIKGKLSQYIASQASSKMYSLSILARKTGVRGSVLICCVGSTVKEIETSEKHIPAAIELAETLLINESIDYAYLYVIENGKIGLEPKKCSDLKSAIEELKKMYPAKMPKHIKSKS